MTHALALLRISRTMYGVLNGLPKDQSWVSVSECREATLKALVERGVLEYRRDDGGRIQARRTGLGSIIQ